MFKTNQEYLDSLNGTLLEWTQDIFNHILNHYPSYSFELFYQRPTLKLKPKLFVMIGGGKNHISLYSTDFDYVEKYRLCEDKKIKFGKSAILFPLNDKKYLTLAKQAIDDIVARAQS